MRFLLAVAVAAFASAAWAQSDERGFYLGGLIGSSRFSHDCSGTCDDSGTAVRGFAGWQANRYLGLELGAADLGEATGQDLGLTTTARAQVVDFSVLLHWPLAEKVSLFGRLGAYSGKTTGTVTDSNTGATVGIGAQFAATPSLALRVEWQDYSTISYGLQRFDVGVLGLSALWRFR